MSNIFLPLLAILFIALKLTDKIDWGWLWVLSPLWIPLAAALTILAIIGVIIGGCHAFIYLTEGKEEYHEWRRRENLISALDGFGKHFRNK